MSWLLAAQTCPGLFYGTSAQDGYLVRIRTPGGILTVEQGRALAAIVQEWGNDHLQVTNRANVQLRSLHAAPTQDHLRSLQSLGLAAQNPQLDPLRNIMASPTAGIDPQEVIDMRPWVQAIDQLIQSHPEFTGLPAKFSIGLDGGGWVGVGTRSDVAWEHRYNEIQLSAIMHDSNRSLQLALGGDKQLIETSILIHPDDCIEVMTALMQGYLDYVSQSTAKKKPRMKQLLADWGVDAYLDRVDRSLSKPLLRCSDLPSLQPTQPYAHLGIHPQQQLGYSYVGIPLRLGQLSVRQLLGLVDLAETIAQGEIRLTPWQTVILPDVSNVQIPIVERAIAELDLDRYPNAIVACAGKPGCRAAATHTQDHAMALLDHLTLSGDRPVNIHVTGCHKSCAQPSPAEITLLGTQMMQDENPVEGYHVYANNRDPSNQAFLGDITCTDPQSMIHQLETLMLSRTFTHA